MKQNYLVKLYVCAVMMWACLEANTQNIINYALAPTLGTFTPLSGAIVVAPTPTGNFSPTDEGGYNAIPIGFPFYYMGNVYTVLSASTNGRIILGATAVTANDAGNNISAGLPRPTLAPLWEDLDVKGNFSYKVTGSPGSRVFTAQWLNCAWDYASINPAITFQAKLYETTGRVEYVYRQESGTVVNTSTGAGIGITGLGTGPGSYLMLTTANASNADTTSQTIADTISQKPATGRTYSFTPPTGTGSGFSFGAITGVYPTTVSMNWSHVSPGGTKGYAVYFSNNAGASYNLLGATNIMSYTGVGLTPGTSYVFKVYPITEGYLDTNNYVISPAVTTPVCTVISGTKSIGPTGNFPSIKSALDSMQAYGISGNIIFELEPTYTSAAETFPLMISDYRTVTCSGASATITLRPAATASNLLITSSNTDATLVLNGIDYFTIDGRPGGTGSTSQLTIENTSVGTTANALRLQNDAIGNAIRYIKFRGANNNTLNGAVMIGTTTGIYGNDSNIIMNCNVSPAAGQPLSVGIVSIGLSVLVQNNNNMIKDNNIWGISNSGILVSGVGNGSYWSITGNSVYDTATSVAVLWTGINFIPGNTSLSVGNLISGNYIGGSAPQLGGGLWTSSGIVNFKGIVCTVNAGLATIISKNNIRKISFTAATGVQSIGINLLTGGTMVADSNIIDSVFSLSNIDFIGINSTTLANITISNNVLSNFSQNNTGATASLRGIVVGSGTTNVTVISNNTIKNFVTNSTSAGTVNTAPVLGIAVISTSTNQFITGNKVGGGYGAPLSSTATTASARVYGIVASGGVNSIQGNVVSGLTSTSLITGTTTAAAINGIMCSSGSNGNLIQANVVSSLYASGSAVTQVNGILNSSAACNILNNLLYGIRSVSTSTGTTTGAAINAINYAGTGVATINNNVIDSVALTAATASGQVNGIMLAGTTGNIVSGNTIKNIFTNSTSGTAASPNIAGINFQGTSSLNQAIAQNAIYNLVNTTATSTPFVTGILYVGATTAGNNSIISKNFIHSFKLLTTGAASMDGLHISSGSVNVINNLLRLGVDSAGLAFTGPYNVTGIRLSGATLSVANVYHNTVYVAGVPATGATSATACLLLPAALTTATADVRNNILYNGVGNLGATSKNYAIKVASVTGLQSNFNLLYVRSLTYCYTAAMGAVDYTTLTGSSGWQAASKLDGQSSGADANLANAGGSLQTVNLHLLSPTPAEGMGDTTVVVPDDFDGDLRSASSVDIGADAGSFTLSADGFAPLITYTPLTNTSVLTNRSLTANIFDAKGLHMGQQPRIYFRKNSGAYVSSQGTLTTGNYRNGNWTFNIDYSLISGGVALGDVIGYFIIAQDSAANIASNPMWTDATSVLTILSPTTTPQTYNIGAPLPTSILVGSGQTYSSLTETGATGVFNAINNGILQGNTEILITSDITETGAVALNQWLEVGSGQMGNFGYTLTIRPDTYTPRVLSGNVANALIRLNGADNVLITGRPPFSTSTADTFLLIRNSNTGGGAVLYQNDATSNAISSTILESGITTTTSGVITVAPSTLVTGNDNLSFSYCAIRNNSTAALPASAHYASVYVSGNPGKEHDNITVNNCWISNFMFTGFYANTGTGSNIKITNSHFFMNYSPSTTQNVINLVPGIVSNYDTLLNNYIGGMAPFAGGQPWINTSLTFFGIAVTGGTTFGAHIQGNVIQNIALTNTGAGTFTGISLSTYGAHNVIGNTIGHLTNGNSILVAGSTPITGIASNAPGNVVITGNTISNLGATSTLTAVAVRGIQVTAAGNVLNVSNNIISNFTSFGTNTGTTTAASMYGIGISGASNSQTISGNTIDNFLNYGVASTSTMGIIVTAGLNTINNNTVSNLLTNSTSVGTLTLAAVAGIANASAVQNQVINNNTVKFLTYASSAPVASTMYGILATGTPSIVMNNNLIHSLRSQSVCLGVGNLSAIVGLSYANAGTPQINNINGNTIHTLEANNLSTAAAVSVVGLFYSGSGLAIATDNFITRNFVHSLSLKTTGPGIIQGINIGGATNASAVTVANNMVRIGIDSMGNPFTGPYALTGIVQSASGATVRFTGTVNYYHNSVYVGGTPNSGSSNTSCFEIIGEVNSQYYLVLKNNILFNAVSNVSSSGKNHVFRVYRQIYNIFNNNIYYYTGVGGYLAGYTSIITDFATLAGSGGWNQVGGQDYNSGFINPQFLNPTGTGASVNLHLGTTNPAEGAGDALIAPFVTTDFDGASRAANTPVDVGADAGTFTFSTDVYAPVITFTPLSNAGSTTSLRTLSGVNITDNLGIPTTGTNAPRLYYSKDGSTYVSVPAVSFTGTATNATFSFQINYALLGGVSSGATIYYYVIAQDIAGNVLSNMPYAVAANVNTVTSHPIVTNTYNIFTAIAANTRFRVGPGLTYTTLTGTGGLFEYLNNSTVAGNVFVRITGNIVEPGLVSLNELSDTNAIASAVLTIQPDSIITTEVLLSGNSAAGLIKIDGADRVKILGIPAVYGVATDKKLRIRNSNNSAATVQFSNDAKANRIHNCIIEGANVSASPAAGVVQIGTSNQVSGNDNDTISGCIITNDISQALPLGVPGNGITSQGTENKTNSGNVIINNEISNFSAVGINVTAVGFGNGDGWVISGNSIYNNLAIAPVTAQTAISFVPNLSSGGNTITNNYIGGSAASCGGTAWINAGNVVFNPIALNVGTGAATQVYGNVIQNISLTYPNTTARFLGIYALYGNANIGISGNGNLIGHPTNINSINIASVNQNYGIRVESNAGNSVINITDNNIQGIYLNSASNATGFYGIGTFAGLVSITNNTIGHASTVNSIRGSSAGISTLGTIGGMVIGNPVSVTPSMNITGNTIANLTTLDNDANGGTFGIIDISSSLLNISSNNIYNLSSFAASTVTTGVPSAAGMIFRSDALASPGVVVSQNNIYGIEASNTNAVSALSAGIVVNALNSGVITRNRIYGIRNKSGINVISAPAIAAGIVAGALNLRLDIRNNQVTLGYGQAGTAQYIGIWVPVTGSFNVNAYYNSILITGNAASGNVPGFAVLRGNNSVTEVTTPVNIINNILINERSGGSTKQYAIGTQGTATGSGWNAAAINYNLLSTASAATLGLWGSADKDLAGWRATALTDVYSWSAVSGTTATLLNTGNLFTDVSTGNLGITTTNTESWYVNGKGIAGSISDNINVDYAGNARGTTSGLATDIGSTEFTTLTTPPSATPSASPAAGTTTSYTFAGQVVAALSWGAGGTMPAVDVKYYTGVNPPNIIAGKTYFNAYNNIALTGGTGYTYGLSMMANNATKGSVSSLGNARMARYTSPNWYLLASANVNAAGMLNGNASFNTGGVFTGTDVSNPLPVGWLAVNARNIDKGNVLLTWSTAYEHNVIAYEVERSADRNAWAVVGALKPSGNSNTVSSYSMVDLNAAALRSARLFYRIRQVDASRQYSYSDEVSITPPADGSVLVYPNPFQTTLAIALDPLTSGPALIEISDMQGRVVGRLSRDVQAAGVLTIDEFAHFGNGIYLMRINAGGITNTVKIIKTSE